MLVGKEMGKCTSGALPVAQAGGGIRQIPAGSILGTGHGCEDGVNVGNFMCQIISFHLYSWLGTSDLCRPVPINRDCSDGREASFFSCGENSATSLLVTFLSLHSNPLSFSLPGNPLSRSHAQKS